nr:YchJ family metal-binding protein [Leucobacter komagatae]
MPCPCGLGTPYAACCGPIHEGKPAPTAAQLMRSRYSAFALGQSDYLLSSWHASTRPAELELDEDTRWLRLIIDASDQGGPFDTVGTVTFTAIGRTPAGRFEQRERSNFVRDGGNWFYVDGIEPA